MMNVKKEHNQKCTTFDHNFSENANAKQLTTDLKLLNQKLWDIEDRIRDKQRSRLLKKTLSNFVKEFTSLTITVSPSRET